MGEGEVGYFGSKPRSHYVGRGKPERHPGRRLDMVTVAFGHQDTAWSPRPTNGGDPFESADPDTLCVWWTDAGVHRNLTHAVHPDPISGMHCWHQAVRVRPAETGDRHGGMSVDVARARAPGRSRARCEGHAQPG